MVSKAEFGLDVVSLVRNWYLDRKQEDASLEDIGVSWDGTLIDIEKGPQVQTESDRAVEKP